MLVVLDSNVLFSALISPHGAPHRIYEAWREARFDLATCPEQMEELRRASRYPKFREVLQPNLVGLMLNHLHRAQVIQHKIPKKHQAADPQDAYLLDLAVAVQAQYLVTGDKRAGMLQRRRVGETSIVTAATFCRKVLQLG